MRAQFGLWVEAWRGRRRRPGVAAALVAALCVPVLASGTDPAWAQGWWPWAQTETRPAPRDPVYRVPPQPPAGAPSPVPGVPVSGGPPQQGARTSICQQLEQRLVQETQGGGRPRDQLPRIEADLRQADRDVERAKTQLERADCYDYFLFSKTLRRSPRCVDMANNLEAAKRRASDLDVQRQQIASAGSRSYLDDIYRELARNGCGSDYNREAARRGGSNPFSSLWQDEELGPQSRAPVGEFGNLPFTTYRTVCVRLCDGYYFPISFSTLPNHFDRDQEACQSKCAAPVELYYHSNPGAGMEQAMSVKEQLPYTGLRTAFRYRKEYVQGCSCKQAEYTASPADSGARKAEVAPAAGGGWAATARPQR